MGNVKSEISHFSRIPNETVLQIFKFLIDVDLLQVAKVCHRFREISNDNSLWNSCKSCAITIEYLKKEQKKK